MERLTVEQEKERLILHVSADLTAYIRANAQEKLRIGKGWTRQRTMRKVGSIPLRVLLALSEEERLAIMSDDRAMREFLKKNPQFRTSEGQI